MVRQRKPCPAKSRLPKSRALPLKQQKSQTPQFKPRRIEWVTPGILKSTRISAGRELVCDSSPPRAQSVFSRPSIIPENHRDFRFGNVNQKPLHRPRDRMDKLRSTEEEEHDDAELAIIEGRRIYLGNIPYDAKPSDIKSFLAEHHLDMFLERIHFSFDKFTGRGPGYCFLEFFDSRETYDALDILPNRILFGRQVRCNRCETKGRHLPGSRRVDVGSHAFKRWEYFSGNIEDDPAVYVDSMPKLFVGNLPRPHDHAMAYNEMLQFFSGFEVVDVSKRYPSQQVRRDAGEGGRFYYNHVIFASQEQAEAALEAMKGKSWRGAVLELGMATVLSGEGDTMLNY